MKTKILMSAAIATALAAGSANAFMMDFDGAGGAGALDVSGLDPKVGNLISRCAEGISGNCTTTAVDLTTGVGVVVGNVLQTYGHAALDSGSFSDANGAGVPPPVIVGHQRLRASLAARAPFYLNALRRDFDPADHTPSVPLPTLAVTDTMELELGDRVLELRAWPTAHTDSDLTVLDRRSATLWLGDLVFIGHLPVLDGNLKGWLAVLQKLRLLNAARIVPGHGPVLTPGPAAFDPTESYLQQLRADVSAALDQGLSLSETVERLGSPPPTRLAGWLLTDAFHRRNLTTAYAELEWAK